MAGEEDEGPVRLADLCRQAVERFGDDWTGLKAYLSVCSKDLSGDERAELDREIRTVLDFQAPMRPRNLH